MSSKPRVRRNRGEKKQFVEKQEQNEVGVVDEDPKNKIEQKHEDMFDPHQLQQNVFQQTSQANQNAFVDFEDDHTIGESEMREAEAEHRKEMEAQGRKQRKQRGKREVKKFDSEEQPSGQSAFEHSAFERSQQPFETKKPAESTSQAEELEDDEIELPSPEKQQHGHSKDQKPQTKEQQSAKQSELSKQQSLKMKQLLIKTPSAQTYVHMHTLMNKAGSNKQQRKMAIYMPLEKQRHSFVYFKRHQSGFSEYYQVIGQDQRPIFFCENQRGCIGCNYYFSLTKEMDKSNPAYLGKLRGNAAGSAYHLYDKGMQPNHDYDRSKFRVTMAYIEYESNFLGMKGPRKLKAVVPKIQSYEDFDMFKFSEEESLNDFQGGIAIRLRNKQPRWNERLKSYALNFGGRVKQASIKNFILIQDKYSIQQEEKAPNAIVFGKIDESTFALEFGHPLSLFQAFGIAMSEFDFKLKCE